MDLFNVLTVHKAREELSKYLPFRAPEEVGILDSLGRILAEDIQANEDVPGFNRSTMDGYAVIAQDTFGATESLPSYLQITGQVKMGEKADGSIASGSVWSIPTGGMLPSGANAVVMIEYTEFLDEYTIGVNKPVAPGENVVCQGEDIALGKVVFQKGHKIRPQDLGGLSASGVTTVRVIPKVRVGIVSTGDEVIEPTETPLLGQVRDINSYTLYGLVKQGGGRPSLYGIIKDDFQHLKEKIAQAAKENDLVLVSGGSSVGSRDVTSAVVQELGDPGVLFHGLNIKPGKPSIGAAVDKCLIFGLPGHPVSAMVVYDLLVEPLICRGNYENNGAVVMTLRAKLTRNMRSAAGRQDFLRVRLYEEKGEVFAEPILGKSGLISTMVKADGLAIVPEGKEGVEAGEYLQVKLF